jgi:hypothetical protein
MMLCKCFWKDCSSSLVKNEYNHMLSYLYLSSPITTSMPIEISLGKTLNCNPRLENLQKKKSMSCYKSMLVHFPKSIPI